ncbi:ABC transporter permease [Thermococcus sibiricus]|uniref:Cellobiose/beta-glucoside ABC transporter, permease component CbtC n=1 Tax=Thermococcus sibiricus (strain DSM 12597 / MM 739) TaxID=604354 RepID=C6A1A2_THESM|nr:ABC transporter permease [Thermococcus sibiricus]ACS89397.1 Cellobiose/beta-glucoside ABC transporter, permease component CbtC [Thermococcus sibiricus MM 739]
MNKEILYVLFRNNRFSIGFAILMFEILLALFGAYLYPVDPFKPAGPPAVPPSSEYLLGTDQFGRDILAQVVIGIRNSLYVGALTGLFSILIGLIIGIVAGIKGGLIDETLMAFTNVVITIPNVLLAIIIATYLGLEHSGLTLVAAIISLTAWPWFARAIRAQLISLRERDFVNFSKMTGYSDLKIAVFDLFPYVTTYTIVSFVTFMNIGINAEVGLSILGLTPIQIMTLGKMLYFAAVTQSYFLGHWWVFIPPGILLVALSTSLLLIATGIEQVFNPRLREM